MRGFGIAVLASCATIAVAKPFAASADETLPIKDGCPTCATTISVPANETQPIKDGCPKNEIACLDVINSSQCIEQLVIEKQAPLTKEAMIKCIETEGSSSTLPGASRYCRCPGCHSKPLNDAIAQLFPPPCA